MKNNIIGASIDVETTGLLAGVHEIVDVSIILHDNQFKPLDKFTSQIRPMRPELISPEAIIINKLKLHELREAPTPVQVRNAFFSWHEEIAEGKIIFPLGHNYGGFDKGFLYKFFGLFYEDYFYYKNRDTFVLSQAMKDCGLLNLDQSLSLINLCDYFDVPHKPHTSHGDAIATLILYRKFIALMKGENNDKA